MERIKNIYCWDCLREWCEAQSMGIVHVKEIKENGGSMFGWEQLVHMMYENCFPQCFLCFRKNHENYLALTREQSKVMEFVNGKSPIQEQEGVLLFFSDYPAEYRKRVLNAQVDSIWIQLDEHDDFI